MRYKAVKRTAIDGQTWWVVYDNDERKYSTLLCFGKYKRKRDCEYAIRRYEHDS